MPSVVLFGDSLTAHGFDELGWGCRLSCWFQGRLDVVNRGFSGYNTRWALAGAQKVFEPLKGDLLAAIIWFGANDACLSVGSASQFVPVEVFGTNLSRLINIALLHCPNVVCLTPPPIDEVMRLEHQRNKYGEKATGVLERTNANTRQYAMECKRVVEGFVDKRVTCCDVFAAMNDCGAIKDLLSDGLHLSVKGNVFVFGELKKHIEQQVPQLLPRNMTPFLRSHMSMPTFPENKVSIVQDDPVQLFQNGHFWDWRSCSFRSDVVVAVQKGKIVHVGKRGSETIKQLKHVIDVDLKGEFVLPGLGDAHIHNYHIGENKNMADLRACKSVDEMVLKLQEFQKQHPEREWIIGYGWDHESMKDKNLPSKSDLDKVNDGKTKIFCWRICYHIAVASTAALEACKVTATSKTNAGDGRIDVDEHGQVTGVLREGAVDLVVGNIKEGDIEMQKKYILNGIEECLRSGLTSIQTNDIGMFPAYKALDDEKKLKLRVHLTCGLDDLKEPYRGSDLFVCERIKIFTDGALGTETAALRNEKDGTTSGVLMFNQETLNEMVHSANQRNFRVELHCIGDAAADATLTALETACVTRSKRPVMTHCQILGPDLIQRMADLGTIANIQPAFVSTDARWVMNRIEKTKLPWSYAWKTLSESGVPLAGGSDAPVEPISPLRGIFDAIYRPSNKEIENVTDEDCFLPDQKLTFVQALSLFTTCVAYAGGVEDRRGRIEPGFDADFTIVDSNIAEQPQILLKTTIRKVYVAGAMVYDNTNVDNQHFGDVPINTGPYVHGKGGLGVCACPH